MRRNSSSRSSSTTMVAVKPVVAVVIPLVVGGTLLLLPSADALLKSVHCGPNSGLIGACDLEVSPDTTIVLDCTGTLTNKVPTDLTNGTVANIKVCKGNELRTDRSTDCAGFNATEVALEGLTGISDLATINTDVGWSALYGDHGEGTDMILHGACYDSGNGLYFNFILKPLNPDTTTSAPPPNPDNNSATSAFGLAIASSVALVGMVVAAA